MSSLFNTNWVNNKLPCLGGLFVGGSPCWFCHGFVTPVHSFHCQSSIKVREKCQCIETRCIAGTLAWADMEDPVLASVVPEGWRLSSDVECRWHTISTSPPDSKFKGT